MLQEQLALRAEGQMKHAQLKGSMLAESAQWKPFVEDLDDDFMRAKTAIVLENTKYWLESLEETTKAISVGDFQKYAFPLVRAIFPELVANSLVSVQPMLGPVSLVFYLDYIYGTTKGSVSQGQKAFDSVALGTSNPNYTSPLIDAEVLVTGTSATQYQFSLSFTPIRAGTVVITDGTQIITDDGNGAMTGDIQAGTNTINYQTGEVHVDFAVAPNGLTVSATYEYDMEAQPNIPELNLQLTSTPVLARPRKLKSKWSLEAAFNLRALHGLEAEVELTSAIGAEIRFEVDREIIMDLTNIVPSSNLAPAWSQTKVFKMSDTYSSATGATDTVGYTEHLLSINNQFVAGGNQIFKSTGRAVGQWIVMGLTVASLVETLPGFVATPGLPNGLTKGVFMAGTLNGRWSIFKDPFYADSKWLMGYKGSTFLEAGYVYAPYIPLYTTPLIVLDDFIGRKGMATQYGKKTVNPRFYCKGQFVA